jgi:hypothetical protein
MSKPTKKPKIEQMSDITHCNGQHEDGHQQTYTRIITVCPLRHTCLRYTEVHSDWDSWMQAPLDPVTGECEYYLETNRSSKA